MNCSRAKKLRKAYPQENQKELRRFWKKLPRPKKQEQAAAMDDTIRRIKEEKARTRTAASVKT